MTHLTKAGLVGIFTVFALLLAFQLSSVLLIFFAGLLVATLLDAVVTQLHKVVPVPRVVLVVIVGIIIALILLAGFALGGASIWQSILQVWALVSEQAIRLYDEWRDTQITQGAGLGSTLSRWLPDTNSIVSQAGSFVGVTLGLVSNAVIIAFLGLFLAINPRGYMEGFLLLLPKAQRPMTRAAMTDSGRVLRGWLVTQLGMMVLIGSLVFVLLSALNVPNATALGLIAGMLNFIPFLGPIISAVPIMLTLAAGDMQVLIAGAVGLLLIQNLEGYILTPILQQKIINLPPAWSLMVMTVLGALFGPLGVALATPIFAVARVLTFKLYIEPRDAKRAAADQSDTRSSNLPSAEIL